MSGLFMGLLMATQFGSALLSSTTNFDSDVKNLDDKIDSMQNKIDSYNAKYSELIKKNTDLTVDIENELNNIVDVITKLNESIDSDKKTFAVKYRTIQLSGVLVCTVVIFIFIFKIFGINNFIDEIILYPFKK
jgi:Na+/phosphate symporter